ncbi:Regulator of RpoS [Sporomusa carbonis]|uniref:response regulator n=1 Tax=Sporomusa carbonis TaxID=3076075 RepID=UPI003A6ADBB0
MRKNVVLFVDDEANILSALKRAVIDQEFEALFANSAQQALAIMRDTPVNVLVTDMRMPQMDGLTMLKIVKQDYPDTVRIVLSGYAQLAQILATINQGDIFKFITKPWQEEDLLAALAQAIEYNNLRQDKKELELMLQQRNAAYKKMLHNMEKKLYSIQTDMNYIKNFCWNVIDYLTSEDNPAGHDAISIHNQLTIFQQLIEDYISCMPMPLDNFAMKDFVENLQKQINEIGSSQFHLFDQTDPGLLCHGNSKLLLLMMAAIIKFLNSAKTSRNFQCKLSSQVYPDKVVVSNVIEIGYVDGVKTLIDKDEVLTKSNIDYYCKILNFLGKPYNFTTTFTYCNWNSSLITLSANFCIRNK